MTDLVCSECDEDLLPDAPEGPYEEGDSIGCDAPDAVAVSRQSHYDGLMLKAKAMREEAGAVESRAKALLAREPEPTTETEANHD